MLLRWIILNLRHSHCSHGRRNRAGRNPDSLIVICIGTLSILLAGCGGGNSSQPQVPQNPAPSITSISPSSAPNGGSSLSLTVNGSNFVSGSVVQVNGSSRSTTFVGTTQLVATITAADLSNIGTVTITVFTPAPGGGTSNGLIFSIVAVPPLSIVTARLPDALPGKFYNFALQASGGIPPYTWSVGSGFITLGLLLQQSGIIAGTPPTPANDTIVNFVAQVQDSANQPASTARPLSIVLRAAGPGRNETCSTATPISNGTIRASISPYGDIDVYLFQGTVGNSVTVETSAQRLNGQPNNTYSYLDTFLEILDSNCNRLSFNDDISIGAVMDSLISGYVLPYTGTYYIRVSDLRGDGRPDFIYDLTLSGAN